VARRGAGVVMDPSGGQERDPAQGGGPGRPRSDQDTWEPERWVPEGRGPDSGGKPDAERAKRAVSASAGRSSRRSSGLADNVLSELRRAIGPAEAARLAPRLGQAVRAYERDRYRDALHALRPIAIAAPNAPAVRELLGLTHYRLGNWRAAIKELDAFRALTTSYDQHPVLADCHRALRHWKAVNELWEDLRQASPGAELVAEGRIVAAGALADRGDVAGGIRLLEGGPPRRKRARPHDLRVSYALAGLYERSGDVPRARELLRTVAAHDPDFVDVQARLAALS
jgi:tetratricopeptide (TPR) repeat protein